MNRHGGENEHSVLLESNLQLNRLAVYGRYEFVQKSAGELAVDFADEHELFNVNALTLGVNYSLLRHFNKNFSLGAQGSLFMAAESLEDRKRVVSGKRVEVG